MKEIIYPSKNLSKKLRSKKTIKYVIFHYTGMQSEIESLKRLTDKNSKVSCHYLINRKGIIFQMVPDNRIAWHAGKSQWKNLKNLNKKSLGIELVNKGHEHGYQNFTNPQIKSLISLCKKLKKNYKINQENFLGHSDIAPLRKIDPGEKFPWKRLNKFKIGLWYKNIKLKKKKRAEKKENKFLFFKNIKKIGYRYFVLNNKNKKNRVIIKAFQRRFLPDNVTGKIDEKTLKISNILSKT